jgi:hypothetical protein
MGDGDDARKSRRYVVAFAFLIALSAQAKAQPLIDDQTPCSVAVRAFDSQDKEKIREAEAFIESVFEQVDQRRRDSGEPGILAQPNDRGASTLMSVAIGFCRQRQKETIRNEATRAYRVIQRCTVFQVRRRNRSGAFGLFFFGPSPHACGNRGPSITGHDTRRLASCGASTGCPRIDRGD